MVLIISRMAQSSSATLASEGRLPSASPIMARPSEWKVWTLSGEDAAAPRRRSIRFSISSLASLAKASSRISAGSRYPRFISQPALAITTDVLPLPAAATTRLWSSSTTTACLCSSVRGLDSTVSKNLRERFNSLSMKAVLVRGRRGAGLRANSLIALSFFDAVALRESGRVSAREDGGDLRDVGHKAGELAVSCVGARGVKLCDAGVRRADGGGVGLEGCPPPIQRGCVKPLCERGRVPAPEAGYRFACLGEVYAHTVPEPALPHLHTLDPVEGDAKGP